MDTATIMTALDKGGVVALLIGVIVGGIRQWWVFGHHYREMRADRDQWRALAMDGHTLNRRAVSALATTIEAP